VTASTLFIALLAISVAGFLAGRRRASALAADRGGIRTLHSLPGHYGLYAAIWAGIPAILLLLFWQGIEPTLISNLVVRDLPPEIQALPPERVGLIMNDVKNLVAGNIVSAAATGLIPAKAILNRQF
jgi:phosphate transport system permease protein